LSIEAEQESFGNRTTHPPRRKPGSILPTARAAIAGKALQSLEKFEAAEAWIPAFAGTARAEIANLSSWSGYLPGLIAKPIATTADDGFRFSLNPSYKSIALTHLGSRFGGRLLTQIGLSLRPRMTAAYALEAGTAGGIGHRSKNPTGNSV
jgi:hypothetical protein